MQEDGELTFIRQWGAAGEVAFHPVSSLGGASSLGWGVGAGSPLFQHRCGKHCPFSTAWLAPWSRVSRTPAVHGAQTGPVPSCPQCPRQPSSIGRQGEHGVHLRSHSCPGSSHPFRPSWPVPTPKKSLVGFSLRFRQLCRSVRGEMIS